jgi:F-type H+-transporting ATPase subunit delta
MLSAPRRSGPGFDAGRCGESIPAVEAPHGPAPRLTAATSPGSKRRLAHLADDSRNADVGARYAQALFDLASDQDALGPVEADLKGLEAARAENADFKRFLSSPAYGAEEKGKGLAAIAKAAGVNPLTAKFLGLLAHNNRASALPAVTRAFLALAAKKRGAVAAEVVSAVPLTEAQSKGVAAALRQALGKDPEMTVRVDPAILGGLKVRVGSRLYDASLKSRLDTLKHALTRA